MSDKPPYRVPSMAEIAAVPPNGFKVISTFSGGGGSSLGFRMAGFKIAWASEFVAAAREVYEANAAPGTILDGRDIRSIDPLGVLKALRMKPGDVDVLEGSPPCSSFSMAGNREADWGASKKYSDTSQRTDDLFFEYVRFIRGMKPKVFVAENVSGLVKGTAKGIFLQVLAAMKAEGYRVEAQLLDAQWLGVPQTRQRLIFVGVRNDLDLDPVFPTPLPYRYSVRDALPWIKRQGDNGPFGKGQMREALLPSPTIGAGPSSGNGLHSPAMVEVSIIGTSNAAHTRKGERKSIDAPSRPIMARRVNLELAAETETRRFTIDELKLICSFPADFELSGTYGQKWERLGRAVPPLMMRSIAEGIRDRVLAQTIKSRRRRGPSAA